MLALWRRVRNTAGEIRGPEWLLLGLETIAVVGGILIAFQLQEWAADRRAARQMDRIADGLLDEARTAVALIWQNIEIREQPLKQAQGVARMLAKGQCPSEADVASLRFAEVYDPVDPPSGIYDELVATAGLSALPDSTARLGIDFYRNARAVYLNQLDYFRMGSWAIVRENDPNVAITFDPSQRSGLKLDYKLETLCADPEFSDRVNYVVRNQSLFHQQFRQGFLTDAAFMCVALADMQGTRCYDGWLTEVIDAETGEMIEKRGRARLKEADI